MQIGAIFIVKYSTAGDPTSYMISFENDGTAGDHTMEVPTLHTASQCCHCYIKDYSLHGIKAFSLPFVGALLIRGALFTIQKHMNQFNLFHYCTNTDASQCNL